MAIPYLRVTKSRNGQLEIRTSSDSGHKGDDSHLDWSSSKRNLQASPIPVVRRRLIQR